MTVHSGDHAAYGAIEGFWAVIPAGGAGTRLWPVSRRTSPKFLHDLTGTGRTLLQGTWDRLAPLRLHDVALEPWEDVVDPAGGDLDVFVACAREIADLLHELIPRL